MPTVPDPSVAKPMMDAVMNAARAKASEDNWKHRSAMMKCVTCMYYAPKKETLGRCRRRSPTMSGWPVMFETDWCGDHKLDEDKLDG